MSNLGFVYTKSENVVSRKIGDEYIIVPIINNVGNMEKLYTLNEVGAFIWENINSIKNVKQIIDNVVKEFDIDENTATQDVVEFIEKIKHFLKKNNNQEN